jgi:hypothetical protein
LSGTSNNYITVRSYPGEWALITDTKASALLAQNIGTTDSSIQVTNSPNWQVGQVVLIGGENMQLAGVSGQTWAVNRGWNGTTATNHSAGEPIILYGVSFLEQDGSYVAFQDFEITSSISSNRVVGFASTNYIATGINCIKSGQGNKVINLVIHNVGHPGIGFWNQHDGGEVNGCLIWGCGIYDNNGSWIRGAGMYMDNDAGNVVIKNNISFRNMTEGMQAYGTLALVTGFRFINNITLMNGDYIGIGVWDEQVSMDKNSMVGNHFGLDGPVWGYTAVSNLNLVFCSNTVVSPRVPVQLKHFISGVATNNVMFYNGQTDVGGNGILVFYAPEVGSSSLNWTLESNSYYVTNATARRSGAEIFQYTTANTQFTLPFPAWQSNSTFDAYSSYQNWPTNFLEIAVQPLDYNTNRWYICVNSTGGRTNATVSLSIIGFSTGQVYELRDAQNFFTVVASGSYGGGSVSLPLTLTNVDPEPGITNFVNRHSNVDAPGLFNVFVLTRRVSSLLPASDLRVLQGP